MASVFRQQFDGKDGERRETRTWYVSFVDHTGKRQRLPGFADKRATEEFGRKLERIAACRAAGELPDAPTLRWIDALPPKMLERLAAIGLAGPRNAATAKPLSEHVADFKQSLLDKGNTPKHAELTAQRIDAVLTGIGAKNLADLNAADLARYLAGRRKLDRADGGLSVVSSNHHLRACKSFCAWLVRERRAAENPLLHMSNLNERTDRKHERRALDAGELQRLLDAAYNGPALYGIAGPDRAMLYRVAVETGLRVSELASLTPASFRLVGDEPTVSVAAAYSKRRRDDTLPLRADTAAELRAYLAGKPANGPAFAIPPRQHVAQMIRADLSDAGIDYADAAGRVVDFHALRHTFITNLVRGGVHPKDAQTLARHSTITLTMDHYAHVDIRLVRPAIDTLPTLTRPVREPLRPTGTDNATPTPAGG